LGRIESIFAPEHQTHRAGPVAQEGKAAVVAAATKNSLLDRGTTTVIAATTRLAGANPSDQTVA
jgi:hypothetical protein